MNTTSGKREPVVVECRAPADHARELLDAIRKDKAACEEQLRKTNQKDFLKSVTGRSSLERAVEEGERILASLERVSSNRARN